MDGRKPVIMSILQAFIERFLEPSEWLGEILFGLIMVLTITLGADVLIADGPNASQEILKSVLGCIFAWGVIDALIFVMNNMFERSRAAWLIAAIQRAASEQHSMIIIRKELDPRLERISSEEERLRLYRNVLEHVKSATIPKTTLQHEELGGALVTFLLVMVSGVPAVVPFILINDRYVALRVSNVLLLTMLFFVGFFWAKEAKTAPWLTGLIVLFFGMVMVGIAKLFGG